MDQKVPVDLSRKFVTSTFVQESARAAQWSSAGWGVGVTGTVPPPPPPGTGSYFSTAGSPQDRATKAIRLRSICFIRLDSFYRDTGGREAFQQSEGSAPIVSVSFPPARTSFRYSQFSSRGFPLKVAPCT